MKILMLMPSMRWWLWPLIKSNYEAAFCEGVEPTLALSVYRHELDAFPSCAVDLIRSTPWIKIHEPEWIPNQTWVEAVIHKNNSVLDAFLPGFEGYVWTPSDDNLIPKGFFEYFRRSAATGKKILVCSHKRGQRIAGNPPYGTDDLVAQPDQVQVGRISGEQYIVHSSLWEGHHFNVSPCGDGEFIVDLFNKHHDEFLFTPDFFVPFNATEPGRFDNDKLKECLDAPAIPENKTCATG
jgi:hypothetical protein